MDDFKARYDGNTRYPIFDHSPFSEMAGSRHYIIRFPLLVHARPLTRRELVRAWWFRMHREFGPGLALLALGSLAGLAMAALHLFAVWSR